MAKNREYPILEVDETAIPIGVVWIHYQRDPFPGGRRYRLHLPESVALVLAERLGRSMSIDTSDDSRECLYWLSSIFSELTRSDRSDETETRYVINSVSSTEFHEDGAVDIYGVCSPFVKGQQ
jgi:hypothetical protein